MNVPLIRIIHPNGEVTLRLAEPGEVILVTKTPPKWDEAYAVLTVESPVDPDRMRTKSEDLTSRV
jgi:hypothetical protein